MTSTAAETVAPWLEDAGLKADSVLKIAAAAETAAPQLLAARRSAGTVVVDLAPGNGHRYVMLCALQTDPSLFGDLLVALPDFNVCHLFASQGAYHVPGYVDEKLRLGVQHATVVAVFLTLLSEHLARP